MQNNNAVKNTKDNYEITGHIRIYTNETAKKPVFHMNDLPKGKTFSMKIIPTTKVDSLIHLVHSFKDLQEVVHSISFPQTEDESTFTGDLFISVIPTWLNEPGKGGTKWTILIPLTMSARHPQMSIDEGNWNLQIANMTRDIASMILGTTVGMPPKPDCSECGLCN